MEAAPGRLQRQSTGFPAGGFAGQLQHCPAPPQDSSGWVLFSFTHQSLLGADPVSAQFMLEPFCFPEFCSCPFPAWHPLGMRLSSEQPAQAEHQPLAGSRCPLPGCSREPEGSINSNKITSPSVKSVSCAALPIHSPLGLLQGCQHFCTSCPQEMLAAV